MATKMTVQFNLFGGTVFKLGMTLLAVPVAPVVIVPLQGRHATTS